MLKETLNSNIKINGSSKGFFENLFYQKIILYSKGRAWKDNQIPLKELNKRFSLMFLTREQTYSILKKLEEKGLLKIVKLKMDGKVVIINV